MIFPYPEIDVNTHKCFQKDIVFVIWMLNWLQIYISNNITHPSTYLIYLSNNPPK